MTPNHIPVFVNERPLQVPAGTSLRDILAEHEPDLATALAGEAARCTDGRGLPVDPAVPVHAGAIFRVFRSARATGVSDA